MEKSTAADMVPRKPRSTASFPSTQSSPIEKSEAIHSIQEVDTFYSKQDVELGTKFDRQRQLRRLVLFGSLRFLLTIGLIASLYGTFVHFQTHGLIEPRSKRIFNFLVTGLSMMLGISIASSFKSIATNLRWWVLSRRKRPIEEVNGILACHSLAEVAKLAFVSIRRKNVRLAFGCFLWLLLNLTTQAAVASLGLTYNLNQDPSADATHPVPGAVSFTNMTQSFARADDDDNFDTVSSSQLAAHTFGENALQYGSLPMSDMYIFYSSIYLQSFGFPITWSYPNGTTFQYYFQESQYNSPDETNTANFYSNRSITASTTCVAESETDFLSTSTSDQASNSSFLAGSTTFYTSTSESCGPRCAIINATESNSTNPNSGWVYTCNVTVSPVYNASVPEHRVSDANAAMAAGAIALQGYQTPNSDSLPIQAQVFPEQSVYGQFLNGNTTAMAGKLSSFAIGVFASADQSLEPINGSVPGFLPNQGLELDIQDPKYMWVIFGGIAGAHLVLFTVSVYIANKVIVVDDNDLAVALLLRTVADDFAEKGCLLDDKERERLWRDYEVIYAPRLSEKKAGARVLEISRLGTSVKDPKAWEGYYDS